MNTLLFHALLLVTVLAPLPLGANREWAWSLCATAVGGLALAWAAPALIRPRDVSLALRPLPVLLFLAVCAWAWVQASGPVPDGWVHPLWNLDAEALDEAVAGQVSLAPDDTFTALMRLLMYGLAFFLAFQLGRDRHRARATLRWLAGAGLLMSVYGLAVYWGRIPSLLWLFDMDYEPAVRGTFMNRNHFATWLGLSLVCLLALMHHGLPAPRNPAYQVPGRDTWRIETFVLRSWRPLAMLILMTAALVLTHSRGGFFSTAAGGVALLLALNHRQRIGDRRARWALAATLLTAVAAFMLTSEILLKRMDRLGADYDTRLQAYQITADGIEDNPLLGFGYGSYADAFRLYRDESIQGFFDKTHNTYLENIFELGWPAALALFTCLGLLAWTCLRGLRERGRDWVYPATGLAATVLVGVHSLFDFSLQLPAIAITYAVLMGVACAQSHSATRTAG